MHIEHNYRSTPQILDAANRLISHNDITPGFEKQLRPTQPDGAPVHVTAYEDQESEADGIANRNRSARTRHGVSRGSAFLSRYFCALAHKPSPRIIRNRAGPQ